MRGLRLVVMAGALLLAAPALATPVPAAMLNKDFESCMGGEDPHVSTERAAYCSCVRDKMSAWDLDTYGNVVTQQAKVGVGTPVPSIGDLAKECIAQVLK